MMLWLSILNAGELVAKQKIMYFELNTLINLKQ